MPEPIDITSVAQWNTSLRSATAAGKTVFVDFHAHWCGPCKTIAPTYTQLATTYPQATFLRVDVDALQQIAAKYQVSAMPTFYAIKSGKPVDTLRGADQSSLVTMVARHSGPNPPVPPLPADAEAAKQEGNKAFAAGNWDAAVDAYTTALKHAPKSPHLHANRALAYLKMGTNETRDKAMQDALSATELDERWGKGWVRLGEVFFAEALEYEKKNDTEGLKNCLEGAQPAYENAVALLQDSPTQLAEVQRKLTDVNARLLVIGK